MISRPGPVDRYYPVTAAQERLWLLAQIDPGSLEYHIPVAFRLRGPLDSAALVAALGDVVERHAALRTRFPVVDDRPVQEVIDGWRLPVEVIEVSGPERAEQAARLIAERANTPFDLAAAVPMRAALLRLGADDHMLCLVMHHLLVDDWSLDLLYRELAERYAARRAGQPAPLPPLPVQYPDYALAQRQRSERTRRDALDHWTRRLAGAEPLQLPTDAPRPAHRSTSGAFDGYELGPGAAADVRRLRRAGRATSFMTLLAGYAALLGLYTGQRDICVGSPVSGRDRTELEQVIGFLLDTVVLRVDLSGDPSFRELLRRARATAIDAFSHPELPAEEVMSALRLRRDPGRNPLFDTMLVVLDSKPGRGPALPGVTMENVDPGHRAAKFDLTVECFVADDGLRVVVNYRTDLFRPQTIGALVRRFGALLRHAAADPDQPLSALCTRLAEDEHSDRGPAGGPDGAPAGAPGGHVPAGGAPEAAGGGGAPEAVGGVLELFAAQVAAAPDAVAVRHGDARLRYAELDRRARRLAGLLRQRGVPAGGLVGVCLPPGPDLVTALLAVLMAGAAYLPLDGDHPPRRLSYLLADSGAPVVVTTGALRTRLPADVAVVDLDTVDWAGAGLAPDPTDPAATACAIYTSGSTGTPKAVLVPHAALAARVRWMAQAYRIGPADRVLQFSSVSFDTFGEELYPCLARGATLVVPTGPRAELPDFLSSPDGQALTVLDLPTAYWHELVADLPAIAWPPGLRLLILGGEQVRPDMLARWFAGFGDRVEVLNTYGPTEASIIATAARLTAADAAGRPPIGYPIAETCLHVVGGYGGPVPDGVPGELLIGGAGVAGGYLNRPELTADRFVPLHGQPHYRTGDRVRRRPDGALEFLGRLDRQLKVRGHRVEPGEVESVLAGHAAVRNAAVVVDDRDRLVAYLVPEPGADPPTPATMRAYLAGLLPAYLHPDAYGLVDVLPLTPNGKLDRAALPPVTATGPATEPRTDGERLVARVFADVLGVATIGADDDFFELGGHSLLATRVAARLRSATGVDVPLRVIFRNTTVAELALAVEELLIAEIEALDEDEVERMLAQAPGGAP